MMNLVGEKYGRLTVVALHEHRIRRKVAWHVVCDCGTERVVLGEHLRSGNTTSCGCRTREASSAACAARNRKHGQTNTPEWVCWSSMFTRCRNPNDKGYAYYGARGIDVCKRWESFENFLADMGPRPPGTTLDRYPNVDGNYEPGNCRWATVAEQNRNKRDTVLVTHNGKTHCIAEWARIVGISAPALYKRFRKGWSAERALSAGGF